MKASAGVVAEDPAGPTTTTSPVPEPGGAVAVIEVSELTVKLVAAVTPKDTPVALVKFEPDTVTVVPPAVGPELGLTPVTTGMP